MGRTFVPLRAGGVVGERFQTDFDGVACAVHRVHQVGQPGRRDGVVRSVHRKERPLAVKGSVRLAVAGELRAEQVRDVEQVGPVAIAAHEVFGLDLRAIRRGPAEGVSIDRLGDAAPDHGSLDPGSAQDLGHLGDVTEHVGEVADRHRSPQRFCPCPSELEVPDDRLARDEEFVHQDLPRPDGQPVLGDEPPDQRLGLRPHLEIVVDGGRLAIEREPHPRIAVHPLEELVHELDETHPERLERLVPLAVPVRVGNEVDDRPFGQAGASIAIARPVCAARRATIRCDVTMSARPSRTPAFGGVPSVTSAWNARSSSSNASA